MKDRNAKATAAQNTRRMTGVDQDTGPIRRRRNDRPDLVEALNTEGPLRGLVEPQQVCEWFARCVRPAVGTVKHPILGEVPTCRECALHLDLDLKTTN